MGEPADHDDYDWVGLMEYANSHGLGGLFLGSPASNRTPEWVVSRLRASAHRVGERNLQLMEELDRVARAFERARIPLMALKGAALNLTVYPRAELRPFRDWPLFPTGYGCSIGRVLVHDEQVVVPVRRILKYTHDNVVRFVVAAFGHRSRCDGWALECVRAVIQADELLRHFVNVMAWRARDIFVPVVNLRMRVSLLGHYPVHIEIRVVPHDFREPQRPMNSCAHVIPRASGSNRHPMLRAADFPARRVLSVQL